jgi:phosphorylcholine metabolism protein LicD
MKSCTPKSNFSNHSDSSGKDRLRKVHKNTKVSAKAAKSIMTEELAIPPARVWDKIEKILDEQDDRIKSANLIIASSFSCNNKYRTRHLH